MRRFVLTCLMLVFCLLPLTVPAEAATYGNLTYQEADGQITITDCSYSATEAVIPESINGYPVTKIGDRAFAYSSYLKSVTIPESVTVIAQSAFYDCALTSIVIPDSVTEIGDNAFYSCDGITDVTLPPNLTRLGKEAFGNCWGLKAVTIPASVRDIGDGVFSNCQYLTGITVDPANTGYCSDDSGVLYDRQMTRLIQAPGKLSDWDIPQTVTQIGPRAFYGCKQLKTLTIPQGVTGIPEKAFRDCSALTAITIPEGVTEIGKEAFYNCKALKTLELPSTLTTIGEDAFLFCSALTGFRVSEANPVFSSDQAGVLYHQTTLVLAPGALAGEYTVAPGTQIISDYAFYSCRNLTGVILGVSVSTLGEGAFQFCTSLQSVSLPASVTAMGEEVFRDCSALVSVTLPQGITAIPKNTFSGCSSLTSVAVPEGVTVLGDYAFDYCQALTSVTLPDTLEEIGEMTFFGCSGLETITIPENVSLVDTCAFCECTGLREVHFQGDAPTFYLLYESDNFLGVTATVYYNEWCEGWTDEVKQNYGGQLTWVCVDDGGNQLLYLSWEIANGEATVTECKTSLTGELVIPDTLDGYPVTAIGRNAFSYCRQITRITVPETVTSIGGFAFGSCTSLTNVNIPQGVTSFGTSVFSSCSSLKEIVLPDTMTQIPDYLFDDCSSLTSLEIPSGVTKIGQSAFSGCNKLTGLTLPAGVTEIGKYAFFRCYALTTLTIPEGVTVIDDYLFAYCSGLTTITVPEGVTRIGQRAFVNCTALTNATIPDTVTEIGFYAFNGCSKLNYTVYECGCYLGNTENPYYALIQLEEITTRGLKPNQATKVIAGGCFYNRSVITIVTLPEGLLGIGEYAFCTCPALGKVNIPGTVTTIGDYAFGECTSLTSMTVPESVTHMGTGVFDACTALTEVTFLGDAPGFAEDTFQNVTTTARYPGKNQTWTGKTKQYGGTITWEPWYPAPVQPVLTPKYPTVSFEDEVVMNVYFDAQDLEDVVQLGLITYGQDVTDYSIENAEHVLPGYEYSEQMGLYVARTQGIPAAEMEKLMYFALYAQLTDGSYVYSDLLSYCPTDYAYSMLENENEQVRTLMVAMLNYGAAAQTYFGTDGQMNSGLTEEQQALVEEYSSDMVAPVTQVEETQQGDFTVTDGFEKRYPSVTFEGVFSINYYVIPEATPVDGITMYVWNQDTVDSGAELTADNAVDTIPMTDLGNGTWQSVVGDIAASQLDEGVYVAFCYSDGTADYCSGVLAYSIGAYCAYQAETNTAAAPFAKATAVYGYYAKQLFNT